MGEGRGQPTIVKKEMGITHADFFSELPALLDDTPYRQSADTIRFQRHGKWIEIALGPEGVRQVSHSVRLPVTSSGTWLRAPNIRSACSPPERCRRMRASS